MDLDGALDRLYAAPLEEFTAMRNALSAALAKDGDPTGAKQLKALKKPNLAAWAVNQFARKHAAALDDLVAATDRVRKAHRRALSGGKATDLREATDARNAAVGRNVKLAATLLSEGDHAAAPSTLAAINDCFMAMASDDVGAELLKRGRLTRELKPGAIVDVGGLTLVEDSGEDEPAKTEPDLSKVQAAKDAVAAARRKVTAALDAIKEADADAWKLQGESDEAERRAKAAAESAEFAKRAADARRVEADEAQRAVDAAQAALREIEGDT